MKAKQIKRVAALLPDDIILGLADNGCCTIYPLPQSLRVMARCITRGTNMVDINVLPDVGGHLEWFRRTLNTPAWIR